MKNIEQILKDAGLELTEEQKKAVNDGVAENYKPIADYNKQAKKLEAAETDRDTYKGQLDTANETLEKFKDIDPDKQAAEIEKYKQQAKEAQETAAKQILERDQMDWLNNKLGKDGYNLTSPRAKSSIIADVIAGKTGCKWDSKAKEFFGFDDLMKAEKKSDPSLYQTAEEKEQEKAKETAAGSAPRYTAPSNPKSEPAEDTSPAPVIF